MSVPDMNNEIKKRISELKRLQERVLPVKVGREVTESVRENFREADSTASPGSHLTDAHLAFLVPKGHTVPCSPGPIT